MTIRRIGFYSGPCCGKSVISATVFTELKKIGVDVELIQEYAKDLAYEKRKIQPYHQLQIFSEQISREYRVLNSGDDIRIISDSPICLNIPYAIRYGFPSWKSLVYIAKDFEMNFPSVNFFLERSDCPYSQSGRYENFDEAIMMDKLIKQFLDENNIHYISVRYNDIDNILNHLKTILDIEKN
jgi:hypothetical protein